MNVIEKHYGYFLNNIPGPSMSRARNDQTKRQTRVIVVTTSM